MDLSLSRLAGVSEAGASGSPARTVCRIGSECADEILYRIVSVMAIFAKQ